MRSQAIDVLKRTVPMGNAADNAALLLQPSELLDVFPMLAALRRRCDEDGVALLPGNNVGYYGPYERLLRRHGDAWNPWMGCHAGLTTLGLGADGTVKGCPSLPTAAYVGGNVRERPLREIIAQAPELTFNAGAPTDHLWGFCATCEHASLCRGGCTWTTHVFFDRPGNNPYCHHRALRQRERGVRERLVLSRRAAGLPFDNGQFEIVAEPFDAPWPADDPLHLDASSRRLPR